MSYIKQLVSKMTLDEKVGALFTLGFAGTFARPHVYDQITKYHCGGLRLTPHARLFGSYVNPKDNKSVVDVVDNKGYKPGGNAPMATAEGYAQLLDELQSVARSRRMGLPLHFSYDQEGGTSADFNFGGVNIFPKPMGIRATGDKSLAYECAKAVARQGKAVGFGWIHSPVLDINTEPMNPEIYTRAYSDNPFEVAEYAVETCRGLKEGGMIATAKHFPGRGHSKVDAHFEMPVIDVDRDTMLKRELYPYKVLIEKDLIPSIMIAHSIFPAFDTKDIATVSKPIITGLLRDELNFKGVITTDSMTMGGVALKYGVANACALSLEAGADLVLMKAESSLVGETIEKVKEFVATGRISEKELDEKVERVLSLKHEYGMFTTFTRGNADEVVKDREIINLSKHIAKASVLVKRNKGLPISTNEKTLVVEQINKTPNDMFWHPGILYKECIKYNREAQYLETNYRYDESDKATITETIKQYDTIIFTNFYIRGNISNNEFLEDIIAKNPNKKIIIITNTPYPLSIPANSESLVITFATSPANIEVTAGTLYGTVHPTAQWPVKFDI